MTPAALARWRTKRDARHLFGFEDGRIVVYEPASTGGAIVATLSGSPDHSMTLEQGDAICRALDRLAARVAAREDAQQIVDAHNNAIEEIAP